MEERLLDKRQAALPEPRQLKKAAPGEASGCVHIQGLCAVSSHLLVFHGFAVSKGFLVQVADSIQKFGQETANIARLGVYKPRPFAYCKPDSSEIPPYPGLY